jgi:Leucine-rich repeat (LRR) protein
MAHVGSVPPVPPYDVAASVSTAEQARSTSPPATVETPVMKRPLAPMHAVGKPAKRAKWTNARSGERARLTSLPDELLLQIMRYLEPAAQLAVRQTSKRLEPIAREFMTGLRIENPNHLIRMVELFGARNRPARIRKLTLVGDDFKDAHLNVLQSLPSLEELTLACGNLTDTCAKSISCCTRLKKLDVSGCTGLGNDFVHQLFRREDEFGEVPNLVMEELILAGCRQLTDISADSLVRFSNLKMLDVSRCDQLSNDFLQRLMPPDGDEEVVLEKLILSGCTRLNEDCAPILSRFQSLKVLNVSGCTELDDDFVHQLFRREDAFGEVPNLVMEELILAGCRQLTDMSADSLVRFSNLKTLDVSRCDQLSNDFLQRLMPPDWSEASDGEEEVVLEKLILSECHRLNDDCAPILSSFKQLKEADISGCSISPAARAALAERMTMLA